MDLLSDERGRCKATSKRTGKRCQLPPMRGGLVCRSHGGAARQVRQLAAVRVSETDALAALATMDIQPVDDPLRELSLLAGEALAWKRLLRDRVAELTSLGYAGATGEQVRASVMLYGASLDRLERVLVSIARLNIDARLVAIEEQQSAGILAALEHGLAAAGVDGVAAAIARVETGKHLRLLGKAS